MWSFKESLETLYNKQFGTADGVARTEMEFSILAILALTCSHEFNSYVIWLIMPYLTDVWNLNFTDAAAIVNVWRGLMSTLPICMLYIADTVTSKFWMILLSGSACSLGFGLLSMSTRLNSTIETGTSTSYEPNRISLENITLFFTALSLTALGISGLRPSLSPFLERNCENINSQEENIEGNARGLRLGVYNVFIIALVAVSSMSYINQWSIKFGLPAICTAAATLVFISGSSHYRREPPEGSPFTTVFRVICAATSKLFIRTPEDVGQLYEKDADDHTLVLNHTDDLRFLDKAAIFLPNQPQEQQKGNRWRLCGVTEVEETKLVIRSFSLCLLFVICGLVSANGHTYFMSQADELNGKKYPVLLLPFLCEMCKNYSKLISCGVSSKHRPVIGIGTSMTLATLCSMIAASVETQRLNAIYSRSSLDEPDDQMSKFFILLVPQFVLLGIMDGVFEQSVASFFKNQVPPTMRPYLTWLSEGIRGVGIISSVALVFVVGKISKLGGKPSWFQDTLNRSRLDKYYWTLVFMVLVNLVFYTMVAFRFKYSFPSEFESGPESPDFKETLQGIVCQGEDAGNQAGTNQDS